MATLPSELISKIQLYNSHPTAVMICDMIEGIDWTQYVAERDRRPFERIKKIQLFWDSLERRVAARTPFT